MKLSNRPEPVMGRAAWAGALIVLVKAAAAFGTSAGWIEWDDAQTSAFNAFAIAVIDVTIIFVAAWQARQKVTPNESPVDENGQPLVPGTRE